jgi:hypothetical protein
MHPTYHLHLANKFRHACSHAARYGEDGDEVHAQTTATGHGDKSDKTCVAGRRRWLDVATYEADEMHADDVGSTWRQRRQDACGWRRLDVLTTTATRCGYRQWTTVTIDYMDA